MTLKLRLFFAIFVLCMAFGFAAYAVSKHIIDDIIEELMWKYGQITAQYDVEKTLAPLTTEIALAQELAKHPNITSWAQNTQDGVYRSVAQETLEHYRWRFDSKNFFIALDQDLSYHFNDVNSIRTGDFHRYTLEPGADDDQWFFEQKSSLTPLAVNIDKDSHLGVTKAWINQSIIVDGQFLGIVGTGLDIDMLVSQLNHHKNSPLSTLFIDRQLRVQLIRDSDRFVFPLGEQGQSRPTLQEVIDNDSDYQIIQSALYQQLNGRESQFLMLKQDAGNVVAMMHYIDALGWFELTLLNVDAVLPLFMLDYLLFIYLGLALILSVLFYLYAAKEWLMPLERWFTRLHTMARGRRHPHLDAVTIDADLAVVERELLEARQSVEKLVVARTAALDKLATYDVMTHLLNRRGIEREVTNELARGKREQSQFGLIWVDAGLCDALSAEHLGQDKAPCLKSIALAISDTIREYDLAARWGESEFLLLIKTDQREVLNTLAQRLIDTIQQQRVQDQLPALCLSVGGSLISSEMTLHQALSVADRALYQAKISQEKIYIHHCPHDTLHQLMELS